MNSHLMAFLLSAGAVTLAEMGDKTQLLAMAFATRFKAFKVLAGVLIATVLNHALAVALGSLITRFTVLDVWIQGIAAISFIFFGLWTIRGDKLEGEENRNTRFGAVATVTVAFFIAELGDKTQLATIALAAKYPVSPVWVLAGTTTGMLIADSIGIFIGVVMCKKIPERVVKLASAGAFMLFGFIASFQTAVEKLHFSVPAALALLAALSIGSIFAAYIIIRNSRIDGQNPAVSNYCRQRDGKTIHQEE